MIQPEELQPYHLFSGTDLAVMAIFLALLCISLIISFVSYLAGAADRRKQIHLKEMEIDRDIRVAEIEAGAETKVAELEAGSRQRVAELEASAVSTASREDPA